MNVSLTHELEQYVNEKVASGMYHTASEVVREGLRLLRERDELQRVRIEHLRRQPTGEPAMPDPAVYNGDGERSRVGKKRGGKHA